MKHKKVVFFLKSLITSLGTDYVRDGDQLTLTTLLAYGLCPL